MKVDEIMSQAREAISVKRVFGEPYEKNGTTVIPVAAVMGGAGGGEGMAPGSTAPGGTAPAGTAEAVGANAGGTGGGFGVRATPAGVYVIHDGDVRWVPALDVGRVILV